MSLAPELALRKELEAVVAEWGSIAADCDANACPPGLLEKPRRKRRDGRKTQPATGVPMDTAVERVEAEAQRVFLTRLAPLADRIIDYFGRSRFPLKTDDPNPDQELEIGRLAAMLTGHESTAEAGKTVLVWAARAFNPRKYQRSKPDYPELLKVFIRRCIVLPLTGSGTVRMFNQWVEWTIDAFDDLRDARRDIRALDGMVNAKQAVQPPATGTIDQGEGTNTRRPVKRRGRPKDSDRTADRRIAEAWDSGRYPKYEDLEREMSLARGNVRKAIDRHRKRERLVNE